jgi:hypothetical protein
MRTRKEILEERVAKLEGLFSKNDPIESLSEKLWEMRDLATGINGNSQTAYVDLRDIESMYGVSDDTRSLRGKLVAISREIEILEKAVSAYRREHKAE